MTYKVIESINDIGEFLSALANTSEVGLDTETSGLDPLTCKLYSLQVATRSDVYVFDLFKFKELKYVAQLLQDKVCIGHNIKYDMEVIYCNTGIMLDKVFDTMLAEVLTALDPTRRFYALDELVLKYCGKQLDKSVRESFYSNGELSSLTQEQIIYMVEDVLYLFQIKDTQQTEIIKSKQDVTWDIECKVEPVVALMEVTGVKLDSPAWLELAKKAAEQSKIIKEETIELIISRLDHTQYKNLLEVAQAFGIPVKTKRDTQALEQISDPEFYGSYLKKNLNLASYVQLGKALYLSGIEVESTGAKVLEELNSDDPIIGSITKYRELDKMVGSFGQKFVDAVSKKDGKLHYQLNQLGARTGRFSGGGDGINMQQIPRDQNYRSCFIAEPGWKLICYDYNQQEYRLAGAVTGEPNIIQSYLDGYDMHTKTASLVFGVPIKEVTKAQRSTAKGVNFAILYGSTAGGLAYNFKISLSEGTDILNKFYGGYPTFKKVKEMYEDAIVRTGYAATMTGRRRYFPKPALFDLGQYEKYIKSTRREGFNMIIQGTGADIAKLACIKIYQDNPFGLNLLPVLTVHDEVVLTVKEEYAEEASEFVRDCMEAEEQKFLGALPAKVEGGIKDRWEH